MRISFEEVETLGEGSFGVVTKNKAPTCRSYYNQHKFVAIKRIKDANDPEAKNEVNVLSHGVGPAGGFVHLVIEYLV